ncbi:MAG: tetratricopeptide repeat protein [Verrucomicrobia bacterium]|nr:tetratricopeptide repeat protein [Verrucomicrobiota bacterium]
MPRSNPSAPRRVVQRLAAILIGLALFAAHAPRTFAATDIAEARKLFLAGQYRDAIKAAEAGVKAEDTSEEWHLLLLQLHLGVGQYAKAFQIFTNAIERYPMSSSIRLRLVGRDVMFFHGDADRAKELLAEINQQASSRWAFRDTANLTALGRAALLLGADPKLVLEKLLDPAKKADPNHRDPFLASGELALGKHDYALASKIFADAVKKFPDDADFHFGLAKSFSTGDRARMMMGLEKALELNTNHVPSLLLLADHLVDAEEYEESEKMLRRALAVNPSQPEAWAYRAVLAHLRNDSTAEKKARTEALKFYSNNPAVDHLIGAKLSQKYRFAEGAAAQRQALRFDKSFLPAKSQLATDLLRLGDEEDGWALADEVYKDDGYDVTAYNLVTLKDAMAKFVTLTNEHFILRMGVNEAPIYVQRALALLERARSTFTAKYGCTLDLQTIVEIFPEQKDFAVRTFGVPGGAGFLGVCFGRVVTANSPASQAAHPTSWEAVLWHEFCHVVTLSLTKNKMPRWLSEGISVYEERTANPAWSQHMNPRYREMVLGKDLTAVSELSAAFLAPKSDLHLQFAYYESSLVVEFLVQQFGLEVVKKILTDLAKGDDINKVIARHTEPMEKLEKDFAAFAKDTAEKLAPGLDFEKPKGFADGKASPRHLPQSVKPFPENDTEKFDPLDWAAKNPKNFYALGLKARKFIADKKFAEAKEPLQKLIAEYPTQTGADCAYAMLAEVHRALGETQEERNVLAALAALDADAQDTFTRLMELAAAAKDWKAVEVNAQRHLGVNPLMPLPWRQSARAGEELGTQQPAIGAWEKVLLLDPPDPAEVHFRLAKMLHKAGSPLARRHVLQALEEAPRFRDALQLLLKIESSRSTETRTNAPAAEAKP